MKTNSLSLFVLSLSLTLHFTIALQISDFLSDQVTTIQGGTNQGWLGRSIKNAGDINNDGYDDIIVSAPKTSSNRTAIYVIYGGKKSTFSNMDFTNITLDPATTGFTITGSSPGDRFGFAVSGAGDVNNDGYDDIIIGASYKNWMRGAAYVIYGGEKSNLSNIDLRNTTLDPARNGFMITGNSSGDFLGYSVSGAGDFNKDGYDDILIGGYNDKTGKGKAYVIFGGEKSKLSNLNLTSKALDANTTGFILHEGWKTNGFGCSVSNAGDVDNDGYDDIIVGSFHRNTNNTRIGTATIIYGKERFPSSNLDLSGGIINRSSVFRFIMGNSIGGYFGYSVSSAGDVNNDGYDDVIIGGFGRFNYQGEVFVIYGGNKSTLYDLYLTRRVKGKGLNPAKTGFRITGEAAGDGFGYAVSPVGDVNGDSYDDIIIGAYGNNNYTGAAYVIYGGNKLNMDHINLTNTSLELGKTGFVVKGDAVGDCFGYSVSSAGDINNDGVEDIMIGTYGTNSGGKGDVYILTHNRCPDNCESCDSPSRCEVCSDFFEILAGQCRACGVGEYFADSKCESCPSNCERCFDSLSCQACAAGYTLFDWQSCLQEPENPKNSIVSLILLVGCPVFLIAGLVRSCCQNKTKDQLPLAKNPNLRLGSSQQKPSDKYNVSKLDQEEPNDDLKKSVINGDKVNLISSNITQKGQSQIEMNSNYHPNMRIDEENGASVQGQRHDFEQPKRIFYENQAENFANISQGNLFSNSYLPNSPPKSENKIHENVFNSP